MVYKYGPTTPFQPGRGLDRDMVIKYGPPESFRPRVKPETEEDEEIKAILKQIASCLKKIKKLLEKLETPTIAKELGLLIAELNLLYFKLNDPQKPVKQSKTKVPRLKPRDIVIAYVVIVPARPKKVKK